MDRMNLSQRDKLNFGKGNQPEDSLPSKISIKKMLGGDTTLSHNSTI